MTAPPDLIRAIRSGHLSQVKAALDAGAPVELSDGKGDPGLPLGIACFMGDARIVRELLKRGAKANLADNMAANAPLALAIRNGKSEVIKVLIEYGVEIPPGVETGLTEQELTVAQWQAQHLAAATGKVTGETPVFEEIEMIKCHGTDTTILDAEMVRAMREQLNKKPE